ncbi:MAG TPA: LacI family DNA-binding transcriptional regulator [Bacilli bacterium]
MSASIKNVADKAGVSTTTVSHVVNATRYVADETKVRVFQAMKELDYRPNSAARSLRSQKSKTVGLLVPILTSDTSNFFFMMVAQGIQNVLKNNGYNLILSNTNEKLEDEQEQIKVLNSQLIDGLIIAPTADEHSYLNDVIKGTYPVVFIDRRPKGYERDCVLADGFKGTYEAIELLINKGHQKIGYITGELGLTTSDERFEGYKKALEDHKISFNEAYVRVGKSTFEDGYGLTREIVGDDHVSALFIANNVMTMGAMGFLQEKRIRIPEELAIIGFDDYEWTKITTPPLSVIKQPSYQLGEQAAEILLKKIKNPSQVYEEYRLPTQLVLRGSC